MEEISAKRFFLRIHPAGYKVLDIQSKVAYVARTAKVFDAKFLSTEENQIHGLCREEKPTHSSSSDPTPARLEHSAAHLKGPEKADLLQTSLMRESINFKS
jgi:hypothetical protein